MLSSFVTLMPEVLWVNMEPSKAWPVNCSWAYQSCQSTGLYCIYEYLIYISYMCVTFIAYVLSQFYYHVVSYRVSGLKSSLQVNICLAWQSSEPTCSSAGWVIQLVAQNWLFNRQLTHKHWEVVCLQKLWKTCSWPSQGQQVFLI